MVKKQDVLSILVQRQMFPSQAQMSQNFQLLKKEKKNSFCKRKREDKKKEERKKRKIKEREKKDKRKRERKRERGEREKERKETSMKSTESPISPQLNISNIRNTDNYFCFLKFKKKNLSLSL